MNNQEELLKSALNKITPDVWDSILNEIEGRTEDNIEKADPTETVKGPSFTVVSGGEEVKTETLEIVNTMKERKPKTAKPAPWYTRFIAVAACLVVMIGGVWGFNGYKVAHAIDSVINLDVNPSIEISVNGKDKVLDVTAHNEDAEKILGDMDFKGSDIDVTINALIGSLLRNGYIDEAKNSILVTVDNKDHEKGEAMRQRLLDEISTILENDGIEGAVLSRTMDEDVDEEVRELAEKYGISEGKAQVILDICNSSTRYKPEDLVGLTINELNLLTDSPDVELSNVESQGKASDKGYIGYDNAVETALKAAGLTRSQVSSLKSEMDYENGIMVYEVEFYSGSAEYEFDIDANSGRIVKQEVEDDSSENGSSEDIDDDDDDSDIDDDDDENDDIDDDDNERDDSDDDDDLYESDDDEDDDDDDDEDDDDDDEDDDDDDDDDK